MKQKRSVSMIGALVLIISAVALITGCPQSNGGTITKNIVEFDSASIKCRNISTSTDIHNGDSIQEKDLLQCKAILPSGKVVENWYINGAKQEYETNSEMLYRVKASDIASGKLKISVVFKDAVQGNVEFDEASVKCKNINSIPFTDVTSGSQIQEKDELMFEAILPTNKVVENWYINDVKQEHKTDAKMFYTVQATDFVSGKLKISVVFK